MQFLSNPNNVSIVVSSWLYFFPIAFTKSILVILYFFSFKIFDKFCLGWLRLNFFPFLFSYSFKLKENKMFPLKNVGRQKPPPFVMLVNYRLKNKIKRRLWTRGNMERKNKNLNITILTNN